jgi:hypothetical protein
VNPQAAVTWQAIRLAGGDALAVRASKKLRGDDLLITSLGATILRKHLDDVPLWRGNHVEIRQLVEDFARYLYLPRLADSDVLLNAVRDGLKLLTWQNETFGYADSYDEVAGRYRALRGGQDIVVVAESSGLLVKPEIALRQLETERAQTAGRGTGAATAPGVPVGGSGGVTGTTVGGTGTVSTPPKKAPRRFHGTVRLDPARVGRDASRVADEVIAHLSGLMGSEVTVTLEIEAKIADGASEQVVRTVTENCRTLRFTSQGFEDV